MKLKLMMILLGANAMLTLQAQVDLPPGEVPPPADATTWDPQSTVGLFPPGNWRAAGVDAELIPLLLANNETAQPQWRLNTMRYLKGGKSNAVDVITSDTNVVLATSIHWYDLVSIYGTWTHPFSHGVRGTNNFQRGGSVSAGLIIRKAPEKVSLERIEGGAVTTEPMLPGSSILFLGNKIYSYKRPVAPYYSSQCQGILPGPDGKFNTRDDIVYRNGETPMAAVDQLYYSGFVSTFQALNQDDIDNVRKAFSGQNIYLILWYRGWGAETGNLLFQLRVDIPIDFTAQPGFAVVREADNSMTLQVEGGDNQVYVLETATTANGPWSVSPLSPITTGFYTLPPTNSQFFQVRQ